MKKQRAVKWLINELRQLTFNPNHHLGLGDIRLTQGQIDELEEQAKEMEEMLLNRFAVDFYNHLRPNKLMTTNDIAQFIIDWKNK